MKTVLSFFLIVLIPGLVSSQNPHFAWAMQTGGTESETGTSIARDASGNIYTTGNFKNTVDFDPGPGVFNLTANDYNIFISKLDAAGNFIWAKHFPNSLGTGYGASISLDAQGNIYVTGTFDGTLDFDPGPGTSFVTANTMEIFALKLNAAGNLVWVKQLGETTAGSGQGRGSAISTDLSGNVFIGGTYHGVGDFDPGTSVFNIGTSSAASCVFITKLDVNGNLVWVRTTEGGSFSPDIAMTLDNTGSVYVTGGFVGIADFDPGPGTFTLTSTSIVSTNIFIFRFDGSGNFKWAKMMNGGPGFGASITTDNGGNVYSTGKFAGTVDFDPGSGTAELVYTGTADIYISKLSATGNYLGSKMLGGNSESEGTAIVADANGNIYVTGTFSSTVDFDPSASIYELTSSGDADVFVTKIDMTGRMSWAVKMGKTGKARSNAITIDPSGNVYTTGHFNQSADFDFGPADFTLSSNGGTDMFVHKINNCLNSNPGTLTAAACSSYTLNGQTYTATGTYTQTLTNVSGCDSMIILNLTIGARRTSLDVTVCENYTWNGHAYSNSGIYSDTLTDVNGCDSIVTLKLTIGSNSAATVYDTICAGQNYYGYTTSGIYTDVFSSANACDSTRILNLTVKQHCIPFSLPNAFTPDGDGRNDVFIPVTTEEISDYSMIIFNRFGQKLFESRSYLFGWNGTSKGKVQPTGSYIYIIRYKNKNGFVTEEKGTVLLLR